MSRAIFFACRRISSSLSHIPTSCFKRLEIAKCACLMPQSVSSYATSSNHGLMEFFEKKENWGESKLVTGRPWKIDELRIKSNSDLHKLWYLLLKERNMVMTMESEYKEAGELFPNPERLEKVEESMENILDVVAERNRAYNLLETGDSGEPKDRWTVDPLGVGFWRRESEHYVPLFMNTGFKKKLALSGSWQNKYLRLWREKQLKISARKKRKESRTQRKLQEKFPNAEIE